MRQPVWNRRIPTTVGMFLLLAYIGGTIALVKTGILFLLEPPARMRQLQYKLAILPIPHLLFLIALRVLSSAR